MKSFKVKEKYMFEFLDMMCKNNPVEFASHTRKYLDDDGWVEIEFLTLEEKIKLCGTSDTSDDLDVVGNLYVVTGNLWKGRHWYFPLDEIVECIVVYGDGSTEFQSIRTRKVQYMNVDCLDHLIKPFKTVRP